MTRAVGLLLSLLLAGSFLTACAQGQPETVPTAGLRYGQREAVALTQCLRDKGWTVDLDDEDYSMRMDVPPSQRSSLDRDSEACLADWKKDNPERVPTREDWKILYQRELEAAKCLERIGYLPIREPISEQEYVDAMMEGRYPEWRAYNVVSAPDEDEFKEIERQCPQPHVDD